MGFIEDARYCQIDWKVVAAAMDLLYETLRWLHLSTVGDWELVIRLSSLFRKHDIFQLARRIVPNPALSTGFLGIKMSTASRFIVGSCMFSVIIDPHCYEGRGPRADLGSRYLGHHVDITESGSVYSLRS